MLPAGGVKKVENGRQRALLTHRNTVFWRWPREDWTRDTDLPGRNSLEPVLPAGGVKKVGNGRQRALLTYRKAVFWRWPREDWTRDADVWAEVHLDPCYLLGVLKRWKRVTKRLCLDGKKRFSGAGRAGTGERGRRLRNVSRE